MAKRRNPFRVFGEEKEKHLQSVVSDGIST
jgi:hypothetical protein